MGSPCCLTRGALACTLLYWQKGCVTTRCSFSLWPPAVISVCRSVGLQPGTRQTIPRKKQTKAIPPCAGTAPIWPHSNTRTRRLVVVGVRVRLYREPSASSWKQTLDGGVHLSGTWKTQPSELLPRLLLQLLPLLLWSETRPIEANDQRLANPRHPVRV